MQSDLDVPSISLVFNLLSKNAEQAGAGPRAIATVLGHGKLDATWIVSDPHQAKLVAEGVTAPSLREFAVSISARSPQRLRSELANFQASVDAVTGQALTVVAGDPQQLRSRAALLADLGIAAVIAESPHSQVGKPPRALPCGIWQLDPMQTIPQPKARWSVLPSRRPTVKQLLADGSDSSPRLIAFDLTELSTRGWQSCELLLGEITQAVSQQQLRLTTVTAIAAELSKQHEVKPQRSILRRAA